MNRQMMREQRRDRKKINKKITDMIKRASQKDEEKIIEFAENHTPLWEILLCYQYQADKQIQSLTTRVLQNMLYIANEEIGFTNILTINTTLGFDERCVAFLAMIKGKTHDMDEISTGTLYYLIQLFEELLEDEKMQHLMQHLEEAYKNYKQMVLSIQLHNILPLAHLTQEKLIESCKNDLAFTMLIITTWLFLHECSLLKNVRNEWVSSVDTVDELFEFLELDNPCLKDIVVNGIDNYLLDDEKEDGGLANIIRLCDMIAQNESSNSFKHATDEQHLKKSSPEKNHLKDEENFEVKNEYTFEEEFNFEDALNLENALTQVEALNLENGLSLESDLNQTDSMNVENALDLEHSIEPIVIHKRDERLTTHFQYCFEIQNELERIISYYCSIILMSNQQKELKNKVEEIEKLNKQLNKSKKSQEKQKERIAKQTEQLNDLEKKIKQSKVDNSPIAKENERLKKENAQFKSELSKLKSQITKLKERNSILEKYEKYEQIQELGFKKQEAKQDIKKQENKQKDEKIIEEKNATQQTKKEEKNEEELFHDMTKEINKHKITILGGPARFSRRVKEFLPNARVIDMGSKFGEIRIGSSDYVVVYWKMLGHARTMQVEAQIKGSSTKIIYADSTNKFELCKTIYENL